MVIKVLDRYLQEPQSDERTLECRVCTKCDGIVSQVQVGCKDREWGGGPDQTKSGALQTCILKVILFGADKAFTSYVCSLSKHLVCSEIHNHDS